MDDLSDNRKYFLSIIRIILLTNIPTLVFLLNNHSITLGWMAGSLASAVSFWLKARLILSLSPNDSKDNNKRASKAFMFRFLFLICWSVLILSLEKPDLITYCISLFSAQIAIVIHHIYTVIATSKFSKYFDDFRGTNERKEE